MCFLQTQTTQHPSSFDLNSSTSCPSSYLLPEIRCLPTCSEIRNLFLLQRNYTRNQKNLCWNILLLYPVNSQSWSYGKSSSWICRYIQFYKCFHMDEDLCIWNTSHSIVNKVHGMKTLSLNKDSLFEVDGTTLTGYPYNCFAIRYCLLRKKKYWLCLWFSNIILKFTGACCSSLKLFKSQVEKGASQRQNLHMLHRLAWQRYCPYLEL